MSTENIIVLSLLFCIIFLPILLLIISSQRENKHIDDEVLRLKIGFLDYFSIINSLMFFGLSLVFLFISFTMLFGSFSLTNFLVGIVALFFGTIFIFPLLNSYNHYWKESKRAIYYNRKENYLLIKEKEIVKKIDLNDSALQIEHITFKNWKRSNSFHSKYIFVKDDEKIEVSDLIKFPQDFFDQNDIIQVKLTKIFIWI
ncbi:hypothetical protein [Empedobacter sedimenti]|uniref:hypothetical protein n=1 Tax=Empedobacter sedimenti TaxID=3042610 RepID=UPI0024A7960F|nr:hypothetical protein [Empedobacter sedimenti]